MKMIFNFKRNEEAMMNDNDLVRIHPCGGGRVHLQIGFVTMCLETEQLAQLVGKAMRALETLDGGTGALRWSNSLPQ
jgi:hypothetical protein